MSVLRKRSLLCFLVLLCIVSAPAASAVIRVKWDSPTNGPGSEWANAYHTVTAGIAASVSGDEVWVAGDSAHPYFETITLKDGVGLYGGFSGTEASRAQRDWSTRVTVLDGNHLGANVVTVPSGAGASTVLDGFMVTNAGASYAGVRCDSSSPAITNNAISGNVNVGIWCVLSSPTVTNNAISASKTGILSEYASSATIADNTVTGNTTYGIRCYSSSPSIDRNRVWGNSGTGISCYSSSSLVSNNIIAGNGTVGVSCSSSSVVLANNTITGNMGAGISFSGSQPVITNNIVAFNAKGISRGSGTELLSNNCVYNPGKPNYEGLAAGPGDISVDPGLVSAALGRLHIQSGSPCVDLGLDSAAQRGWTDMDGQARIQGAHVDIGADESGGEVWPSQPLVVRVSPSGTDDAGHDGSSWALAKRTVQSAVDAASAQGGEVWVAAGTYAEHVRLLMYVHVYGGFSGVETALDMRNWALNKSILDGSGTGTVVTTAVGYQVNSLSGLTIRNSGEPNNGVYCSYSSPSITGNMITSNDTGVYCYYASPSVAGNSITGNGTYGVYCDNSSSPTITSNLLTENTYIDIVCKYASSPVVEGNTISGNRIGVSCDYSSAPLVTNNRISENEYAFNCSASAPSITTNTISANRCGITCTASSSPSIAGNILSANGSYGVSCDASSPSITNNTISGSAAGITCTKSSSPLLTNNIVAFNGGGVQKDASSAPVLKSNCVYNPGGSNYVGLTAGTGDLSLDPKFASAEYGRLHLQPDSPCVDGGLDSVVPVGANDIDGQPRLQGAHVDMGADESDGTVWPEPVVVRVSTSGVDDAAHDGSSWALAKRTVQAGIDAALEAGGEVWVAAGTYAEEVQLPAYSYMYGGFAGAETARDQRNWVANKSVLVGGTTGDVVSASGGYRVSAVDGFTIQIKRPHQSLVAGIGCTYSSPSIAHNTLSGNGTLSDDDTGIRCSAYSSPSITNNMITSMFVCGINCSGYSSPAIVNNTILGVTSGTGIYCSGYSSPLITNNIVAGHALGISLYFYCSPSITGNTIAGNRDWGIRLYWHCSPSIANNIVAFNRIGVYKYDGTDNPALTMNCVYSSGGINYENLPAGPGDISVDPLFVNRAAGDYHLQVLSPCIDKGVNSAVLPGAVDMDGEPRIVPAAGKVDMGADEFSYSIADARAYAPDGHWVYLSARSPMVTTAKFAGEQAFYVERPDRSSGLRCTGTGLLDPGQTGVLQGIMGTVDGERIITQASVVDGTLGTAEVPKPLSMACRAVGGASLGLQLGTLGGQGLNSIGLLAAVTGKVTFVDPGGQFFTIWDASMWGVTPPTDPDGHTGVRISAPGMMPIGLKEGDFVSVTGISSCSKSGANLYPRVLVRSAGDIVVAGL